MKVSSGLVAPGLDIPPGPEAIWGYGVETSTGKDTPSGHWEIAGVPVTFAWTYFPDTEPAFPAALTDALIREAKLPGILGNKHASGMPAIQELGRWAATSPRHDPTLPLSPASLMLSLRTMLDRMRAKEFNATIGFEIAGEAYLAELKDGDLPIRRARQFGDLAASPLVREVQKDVAQIEVEKHKRCCARLGETRTDTNPTRKRGNIVTGRESIFAARVPEGLDA